MTGLNELMGKLVTVDTEYYRHKDYATGLREWRTKSVKPRTGWVVGVRTIHDGEVRGCYEYGSCFAHTSSHRCILVAYWPTMKPVKVPLGGFAESLEPEKPTPPAYEWTDENRRELREIMKGCRRDSAGRFLPEGRGHFGGGG